MCESGCGEEETIEHVLCHCGSLEEARVRNWEEEVEMKMMTTQPEICRRILAKRFQGLIIKKEGKPM